MKDLSDTLGWSYKFDLKTYIDADIEDFCIKVDTEFDCFGIGFLLAFFHIGKDKLTKFQEAYGYFPFDAYLTLWEQYTNNKDAKKNTITSATYNQRNSCLEILTNKGLIIKDSKKDTYELVERATNPYTKYILRKKNLELLDENNL